MKIAVIPEFPNNKIREDGVVIGVRGRPLKPLVSRDGYHSVVVIRYDGKKIQHSIHRLMGAAFLGLELSNLSLDVDHKNEVKSDNSIRNLQLLNKTDHAIKCNDWRYENDTIISKKCRKCEVVKPKIEFGLRKNRRDGLQSYCNSCR